MPTKEDLENIIKGLGFDPNMSLEDYVKIGNFLYPKNAPVELRWSGEYREFKRCDGWYFEEHGDAMRERLNDWGIEYDEEDFGLYGFVEYGGPNWQDARSGIQAKISKKWDSLEDLMAVCDDVDIALADTMKMTLPRGEVIISDLRFEKKWKVDKSNRKGISGIMSRLTLAKSGKIGTKGMEELLSKLEEEVSFGEAEKVVGILGMTSSANKMWKVYLKQKWMKVFKIEEVQKEEKSNLKTSLDIDGD